MRTAASLHTTTLYGLLLRLEHPRAKTERRRSALKGHQKEEEGEERKEKGPDRREERTMASKETTSAGFANVSREITGEREHELFSGKYV